MKVSSFVSEAIGGAGEGGGAGEAAGAAGAEEEEGAVGMVSSPSSPDAGAASGPPPIVSLDEMARAEALEKKIKRKARPAGKKVGWADRAGRILQVVKEFHSEDAAQAVSETPQESPAEVAVAMAHHHDHKHWAERVKREREMERKFHGKSGKAKAPKGEDGGDVTAEKRKKAMVPAVSWRRPGRYQEGVVHEDVMLLEVESSEAESQGARTRAGLEQVRAKLMSR